MNKQIVPSIVAVAIVVAGIWLLSSETRPIPDVTFSMADGSTLNSSELRGKKVLINFWSITCEACLKDIPTLNRLHDSLKDQNFMVIGVAASHDAPPAVIDGIRKLGINYPVALDVHGEVSKAFGDIRVTPTNVLVDPQGNINSAERGPLDEPRLRATLLTFGG